MQSELEYRQGKFFALRCDGSEWTIDRNRDQISVIRVSLLGRRSERTIPLEKLVGMTVRLTGTPPKSLAAIGDLLRTAYEQSQSGEMDADQLASKMPRELAVRFDEKADADQPKETELRHAIHGIEDERDLVALSYQIADAAGLGYCGVFCVPGAGFEVHLSRTADPRLSPLKELADDAARTSTAAAAVDGAELPPFEPNRLNSSYKVEDWAPGRRVVLRRPSSRAVFLVFPFTLLLLVGPGIVIAGLATGQELHVPKTLILTALSAAFGITALVILGSMLPGAVVFDWSSSTLSIRKRFRTKSLPFNRILRLEAHACDHEVSSDGGGSGKRHACELKAILRSDRGVEPEVLEILRTDYVPDPDGPLRQGFPLAAELAKALGVEYRAEDYSFRKSKL